MECDNGYWTTYKTTAGPDANITFIQEGVKEKLTFKYLLIVPQILHLDNIYLDLIKLTLLKSGLQEVH